MLLSDEGVGVHAAHALIDGGCPDGVTVLDVGTAILDALPFIEKASRIIVVDTMQGGGLPGTVYRTPFHDCAKNPCIASIHGFDLSRVLSLAQRSDAPEILVIGVEPKNVGWSLELSSEVAGALPAVLKAVRDELVGSRNADC